MSDTFAAAERFLIAYVSGGEAHMDGHPADDILALAADDLAELAAGGPEAVAVAMLALIDAAVDLISGGTGAGRLDVVRSIVSIAEQRRAAT